MPFFIGENGGEGGIRTLGTGLAAHTISSSPLLDCLTTLYQLPEGKVTLIVPFGCWFLVVVVHRTCTKPVQKEGKFL